MVRETDEVGHAEAFVSHFEGALIGDEGLDSVDFLLGGRQRIAGLVDGDFDIRIIVRVAT